MSALDVLAMVAALGASVPAGLRWLRVLQREHYLAGSTVRFAVRWWRVPVNHALLIVGLSSAVIACFVPPVALLSAAVAATSPWRLSIRGRTSPLAWTRRLKTVALATACLELLVVAGGLLAGFGPGAAALCAMLLAVLVDAAAWLLAPIERRLGDRFIRQAADQLRAIGPRVVGITGSYGKTSTKNHLVALLGAERAVVPSPRSFNNRAGLARAINEQLAPGTEVFIAEMGTYGPGEIADLVSWCPPEVAVLTAIGPVHLERFGSLEVTLKSKAEICGPATSVVLNIDDPLLAELAGTPLSAVVIRASALDPSADVAVIPSEEGWDVFVKGAALGSVPAPPGVQATNVACALGAAIALGFDPAGVAARIGALRAVENRQSLLVAPSGLTVVDDTFNANPAGAAAALALLDAAEVSGRRVVVTPGMIELGVRQGAENEAFATHAAEVADVLVIVGRTNAAALRRGAEGADNKIEVRTAANRDEAVAWVREALGARDAVLYENDLPDHYP